MISVTPSGSIYLCKTPLINDYKNQLTFSNAAAQLTYFTSTVNFSFDNYTYVKKDNVIKVGKNIDEIINCNYLFYRNTGFTSKYYFCFITNMEYINENCTAITIETDCFQSYQFDISYKRCFVEREHVNDDTIGLHTIEEGIDTGEIIQQDLVDDTSFQKHWIVVECEWDPNTGERFSGVSLLNGNFQAYPYYFIKYDRPMSNANAYKNLTWFLLCVASGKGVRFDDITTANIEYIKNIFIVPQACVNENKLHQRTITGTALYNSFTYYDAMPNPRDENPTVSENESTFFINIQKCTEFTDNDTGSVVPIKNNKCYCYPYNYLMVSNNIGNQNIYKYEYFNYGYNPSDIEDPSQCTFKFIGSVAIGASGKLLPMYYKHTTNDWDESIPLPKYPVCSWSGDAFTNWLTQNAVNMATNIVGVGSSATMSANSQVASSPTGSLSSSGAMGVGTTIAGGVLSTFGSYYSARLLPNIQGGQNTADVNFAANINTFVFHRMRSKTEYITKIDNYFSMFGYKVNDVKIPNITGRPNWNYVKTLNCNFVGNNIPQQNLNIIRSMFDNGVTLWHNPTTMYDYSQSNAIPAPSSN